MCTPQAVSPPRSMWTCPKFQSIQNLGALRMNMYREALNFLHDKARRVVQDGPDVKHSNGPASSFFYMFFLARLFVWVVATQAFFHVHPENWGRWTQFWLSHMFLRWVGEKPPTSCLCCFNDIHGVFTITKSASTAAWGWSSDGYPGDQASGMMGMYVLLGPCLGFSVHSPPPWKVMLGRWVFGWVFARRLCLC